MGFCILDGGSRNMNNYNAWRFLLKKEITYSKMYVNYMQEELLLVIVFDYREAFEEKLIEFATSRVEIEWLMELVNMPYGVEVEGNGNLRVFNF